MDDLVDLTWLEKELKNNNGYDVSKILSVDITPAVGGGENYASTLLRLELKVLSKEEKENKLYLILKRRLDLSRISNSSVIATLDEAFFREHNAYVTMFPKIEQFLKEKEKPIAKLWADCLATFESKDFFFEDLKDKGYRLSNRQVGLDEEHCHLVFQSLGKFHAASYLALSRGLISTKPYKQYPMIVGTKSANRTSTAYDFIAEIILSEWEPEWKYLADKINDIKGTIKGKVAEIAEIDSSKINVINHGDPWINNMMFKYDDNGKPSFLKFVDFQMPHYNSFAFDISYILNTSVPGKLKEEKLENWIQIYCNSFHQTVNQQGCVLPIPSPQLVKEELRRIRHFSLNICIRNRPIMMCKPEDSLPLSELIKDDGLTESKRRIYTNPILAEVLKTDLPVLLADLDS